MRYVTSSVLFAVAALALCLWFLYRCVRSAWTVDLSWVRAQAPRSAFAGGLHPMEKKDTLPVLLITLAYALTAFFQLGDLSAPRRFVDLGGGQTITIQVSGDPVRASGIRYYGGLGTGSYNIEASADGAHWSTLWQHKDANGSPTGWYWADAQGYDPSFALGQNYNQIFKWLDVELENPIDIQYLRITGRPDVKRLANGEEQRVLQLGSLALVDREGKAIPFNWTMADGSPADDAVISLFYAAQVPDKATWRNSTYFDEIYHARTADEHLEGLYPYEITHPPLGKLILGLGISLFGMTPFGWRFMGTLFGVLMLPILYVFLKNMFGKTPVAACGTTLFAAEFMHLTQTRIATIDTYGVFFILCMYFFLYRYLTLPAGTSFAKGALPLFLSGLMWGLGISAKWTVIYGGIGLAVVYFIGLFQKLWEWPVGRKRAGWLMATLLFSVFCFILMPFAIYTASYLPYAKALGVDLSLGNTLSGLKEGLPLLLRNVADRVSGAAQEAGYTARSIPQDSLGGVMCSNQWYMFTYHQGVTSAHPYSSWWFQWVVDGRPILYYMDNAVAGHTTRFAAFANPIVCWAGLGAILVCFASSFRRLWAKLIFLAGVGLFSAWMVLKVQVTPNGVFDPELSPHTLAVNRYILLGCLAAYLVAAVLIAFAFRDKVSGPNLFITVAYLSQLVPWMFIGRTTFEYHYFPSILFLVFAIAALFDLLMESGKKTWQGPVYTLTGAAVAVYTLFYPVLIGLQIPTWYERLVKWLESWPF